MSKKFTFKALLLSLMLFTCCVLSACGGNPSDYKINLYDTDVAKISLFSYSGKDEAKWGLMNLGHCFVSIENTSSEDINLYKMTIPSGETVAIGTWSLSEHFGIWFNIESNFIASHNKYDGRYSITTGLSQEDLEKIDDYMKEKDMWGPIRNCSYFALNMWNEVAEDSEKIETPLIYTPSYVEGEIKKFDNYEKNRAINTSEKCFYYDGDNFLEFKFGGNE